MEIRTLRAREKKKRNSSLKKVAILTITRKGTGKKEER